MRIGLFFGSFNPIHIGHLVIADVMANHTDLDQVWFVVSPQNPFKSSKSLLHEFDRLKMVDKRRIQYAVEDYYAAEYLQSTSDIDNIVIANNVKQMITV